MLLSHPAQRIPSNWGTPPAEQASLSLLLQKKQAKELGTWMQHSAPRLCFLSFSSLKKHTFCSAPPCHIWGVSRCHFAICGWCEFCLVLPSEREFTYKQIKNILSKISFIRNKGDILKSSSWHLSIGSNSGRGRYVWEYLRSHNICVILKPRE